MTALSRYDSFLWIPSTAAFLMIASLAAASSTGPVVVELFESQGCSSCPPAERTLETLKSEFGDRMIPVVFHVDYWDGLGWKDSFSSSDNTERQKTYGSALNQSSIYTPEMVIDGEVGFVGSDTRQAREEIQNRLNATKPLMTIHLQSISPTEIKVSVRSEDPLLVAGFLQGALVEDAASVHVLRGENAGETMSGSSAVRRLFEARPFVQGHTVLTIRRDPTWNAAHLNIVVWVTNHVPKILAAQQISWNPRPSLP